MKRPLWAKHLPARLWRHLQEQQQTNTPSLRRLREDVAHQQATTMTCWECKDALALTEDTNAAPR